MKKINALLSITIFLLFIPATSELKIIPAIIPAMGEEWENIDSFNVHPANRWDTSLSTSEETLTVENGLLTYNDDGSVLESSARSRQLMRSDCKINGRFQSPELKAIGNDYPSPNASEMVFYLRKNEGQGVTTEDATTNNHDGDLTGHAPDWVSSFNASASNCLDYEEGSTEYVNMGDHADFTFSDGSDLPFSWTCWLTMESNGKQAIMAKYGASGYREYYVQTQTDNLTQFALTNPLSGAGWIAAKLNDTFTLDHWYFLACTYNGNETKEGLRIYVQGQDVDQHYLSGGTYTGMGDSNTDLRVGHSVGLGIPWDGKMDECILWNRCLSASEVNDTFWGYFENAATGIIQGMIGLEDNDVTLDLSQPGCAIIFETYNLTTDIIQCYFGFTDINNDFWSTNFFNLTTETYYRFQIDIDVFKSEMGFTIEHDNGTEIDEGEQDFFDINETAFPRVFQSTTLKVFYGNYFQEKGEIEWVLDYLEAPFEEFMFKFDSVHSSAKTTAGIISSNEYGMIAEIDVTDVGGTHWYEITVPSFDSCSGVLYANTNETTEAAINEIRQYTGVQLRAVNATTGNQVNVSTIIVGFYPYDENDIFDTTFSDPNVRLLNSSGNTILLRKVDSGTFQNSVEAGYCFYKTPNGNISTQLTFNGMTFSYEFTTNNTDLSEFVVVHIYQAEYLYGGSDNARFDMGCKDFQLLYRDMFGFLPDLPDLGDVVGGATDGLTTILSQLGRLFGTAISSLGDVLLIPLNLIKAVLDTIKGVLDTIKTVLDTISGTISTISGVLDSVYTEISNVLGKLGDIFEKIGDIYDEITGTIIGYLEDLPEILSALGDIASDIVSTIWTAVIAEIGNIFDEILTWLLGVVTEMAGFLVDLVVWLWDNTVAGIFGEAGTWMARVVDWVNTLFEWAGIIWSGMNVYYATLFLGLTAYIFYLYSDDAQDMVAWIKATSEASLKDLTGNSMILGIRVFVPLIVLWALLAIFWGVQV